MLLRCITLVFLVLSIVPQIQASCLGDGRACRSVSLGALFLLPLEFFNVSINLLSLFAFILVLGIVVDDAIIMGESAYTEIDHKGQSVENVIIGVKKVAMPATFGVLNDHRCVLAHGA